MTLRWVQLGTLTMLLIPGTGAQAQSSKADRDGGLMPPVIQVMAREPIDEEEITVELIKAMPRTRDEMKGKIDLGENFKVIKIKRDKTDEPISMTSEASASVMEKKPAQVTEKKADKPADKIIKVRRDEPLNFLPAEKQKSLPSSVPVSSSPAPGLISDERPTRTVKTPVRESAHIGDLSDLVPSLSWPGSTTNTTSTLSCDNCELVFPTLADSNVGWIDSAIVGTQARLRYDARWRNPTPDRAEFYVARSKQYFDGTDISGRGFSIPESNIDLFDVAAYFEWAMSDRFSVFYEMPIRYIRPTENNTAIGVGDINFGFKFAYFMMPEQVQTFQLRLIMPTGQTELGLGTGHVTIEPSLLLWQKLSDNFTLESELRNWIPVGGTNYAGYTLRYAMGLSYNWYQSETMSIKPVTELIGWSTLRGYQSEFIDSLPTFQSTQDARGTVIESAWGLRGTIWGNCDWYTGYSFAVTSTTWFENNFRAELRWRF